MKEAPYAFTELTFIQNILRAKDSHGAFHSSPPPPPSAAGIIFIPQQESPHLTR